jgi:hypothetical protein
MEPETVWQEEDCVQSGGGVSVRAAKFTIDGNGRGGVTCTVRVPDGFWQEVPGGGATASLLITADEARGIAAWLDAAAEAADLVGPPSYP